MVDKLLILALKLDLGRVPPSGVFFPTYSAATPVFCLKVHSRSTVELRLASSFILAFTASSSPNVMTAGGDS